MLNFQYGPDGSVYVIDWYDKNQCHSTNPELHQKTLGRIFKISHASDRPVRVDLARLPSSELVAMQLHRNDWYVQHARRLLQERGPDAAVHAGLKRLLAGQTDDTRRLRAMWALHVTGGLTEADLVALLDDASEYVRGWAITLLVEAGQPSAAVLRRFAGLARDDASALVRLQLASALQRVPVEQRWDVVAALAGRAADATDRQPGADGVVRGRAARRAGHAARPRPRGGRRAVPPVRLHRAAHRRRRHTSGAPRAVRSARPDHGRRAPAFAAQRHHPDRQQTRRNGLPSAAPAR